MPNDACAVSSNRNKTTMIRRVRHHRPHIENQLVAMRSGTAFGSGFIVTVTIVVRRQIRGRMMVTVVDIMIVVVIVFDFPHHGTLREGRNQNHQRHRNPDGGDERLPGGTHWAKTSARTEGCQAQARHLVTARRTRPRAIIPGEIKRISRVHGFP
jgi:hypothetical protein